MTIRSVMPLLTSNITVYSQWPHSCKRSPAHHTPSYMVSNIFSPFPPSHILPLDSLSASTRMTYRTGQKSFTDFIILYPQFRNSNGSILPASQSALLEWVAWLGGIRRIQPKTIKSYITHLRSVHVDADLHFSACESPLLQCVIRGIK